MPFENTNILILPSWYGTEQAPTSGSFFQEQSLLMEDKHLSENKWAIFVLTTEKIWISKQRELYYRYFPNKKPSVFSPQFLKNPAGFVVHYPFCKYSSDAENLDAELKAILAYYQLHPDQKPALIHAHSTLKGGILARLLAKHWDIPYLITEHMNPFLLHGYTDFWKKEIIQALEEASAVLAVSEHQRQHLLMHEINCNPISVGNLVDDARFTLVDQQKKEKIHFLIVTFYPNFIKDMDTFFEAIQILKSENKQNRFEFTVVGGGEIAGEYDTNYYQNKIEQLGVSDFVKVIPKASRAEMPRLMQEADALISTSIAESFGVAICEAMLCGKPVISTKNGGINDYGNTKNAILIPIKSPIDLVHAILNFEAKKADFDPAEIRESIVSKYGRKAFRARIDQIYLQQLNSKRK